MSEAEVIEDGEIVEDDNPRSLVLAQPTTLFGTSDPHDVLARAAYTATALREFVEERGLIVNIQGKAHPLVEAWTTLGTLLGVFPITVWTHKLENGWEARVEARTMTGAIIGAAEAECLRSESSWRNRDSYALRSMAQTRATSKALRQPLGFIMHLAGYSPTPAEEIVDPSEGSASEGTGGRTGGDGEGPDGAPDPSSELEVIAGRRDWLVGHDADTVGRGLMTDAAGTVTQPQLRKMAVLAGKFGWDDDERHRQASIDSWTLLSKAEASYLIDQWEASEGSAGGSQQGAPSHPPRDDVVSPPPADLLDQARALYGGTLLRKARILDPHLQSVPDIPEHVLQELVENQI